MSNDCRCPQCFGLREYMLQLTGKDYGLPRAPGHNVVEIPIGPVCDGTYECACPKCVKQRRQAAEKARQVTHIRQPWEPKPAKRAA